MGLDSVELVMEVEKYFSIEIPDQEAEKIYRVQDMVETVARHLKITLENSELQKKIITKLSECFSRLNKKEISLKSDDLIYEFLTVGDKENWKALQKLLDLKIPRPSSYKPDSNKLNDRFKKLINWTPHYKWNEISVSHFSNVICAHNYTQLLDQNNINDKLEIYVAVMGITVEKIGIDYYEIYPTKSFTDDLGVS
ncbi:MAG: hypothetical protein KDB99_10685 [Chitinophagaceae bacterium]|nr:hypothetical protein [Chitinophagaceae bacterium]MCB9055496.1 hypothetical protein [Chitinophagales bacterium]